MWAKKTLKWALVSTGLEEKTPRWARSTWTDREMKQGNKRQNGEGRMEHRANYVLWTCLSDCLETSKKKQKTFVLGVLGRGRANQRRLLAPGSASFIPAASVCIFHISLVSAVTVLVHQSPGCLDNRDAAAPSTNQTDNDIFSTLFSPLFRQSMLQTISFYWQWLLHNAPTPVSIRTDGLKGRRVMSLQQILQEATAAVSDFQLGRTGSLQREVHSF